MFTEINLAVSAGIAVGKMKFLFICLLQIQQWRPELKECFFRLSTEFGVHRNTSSSPEADFVRPGFTCDRLTDS